METRSEILGNEIVKLLKRGIIVPTNTELGYFVMMSREGDHRMISDLKKFNEILKLIQV